MILSTLTQNEGQMNIFSFTMNSFSVYKYVCQLLFTVHIDQVIQQPPHQEVQNYIPTVA